MLRVTDGERLTGVRQFNRRREGLLRCGTVTDRLRAYWQWRVTDGVGADW